MNDKIEMTAFIWVRSITLVNEQCSYCNITYTEYLSHTFKSCCITADRREIFYHDISTLVGMELVNALKNMSDRSFYTALLTGDISIIMKIANFSFLDFHTITSSTACSLYRLHLLPIYMHTAVLML